MASSVVASCEKCGNEFHPSPLSFGEKRFCSDHCRTSTVNRGRKPVPMETRFWRNVDVKPDGQCWLWTAGKDKDGYGKFKIAGRHLRSHRVSYEMHYGPIPEGMCVCHSCDNPSCVRPDHLFSGTNQQNMDDRNSKGRTAKRPGEKHGNSKLTDAQVLQIRSDDRHCSLIAAEHDVHKFTIRMIQRNKAWRHLPWSSPTEDPNN